MTIYEEISARLGANSWFANLPAAVQQSVCREGRVASLQAGQWIYSEGDSDTGICAVLEGYLRLEVGVGNDRDVLVGLTQASGIIGQSQPQGGGPRIVTARAGGAARVLLLSDAAIERIAGQHPSFWRAINALLYQQLNFAVHAHAQYLLLDPAGRVAALLLQLTVDDNVPASQSDIAEMTGLSRKTVNGHLAQFEAKGLVSCGYRSIRLLDVAGLRARVGRDKRAI